MTRIADEMLMAYADGELEPAAAEDLRRAIAADPDLARRLDMFARTRAQSKAAYHAVLEEPAPDSLVAMIRKSAPSERVQTWSLRRFWLPAAAVAAAAVVGYTGGARFAAPPATTITFPTPAIAEAASTVATGSTVDIAEARVTIAGSYATSAGYCRVLGIAGADGGWRAVACSDGGPWSLDMVVADPGVQAGSYTPASGGVAESIDAFLDAAGAGAPLEVAAEQAAIGQNWRPLE